MADITLSNYSDPAHSVVGITIPSFALGSDVGAAIFSVNLADLVLASDAMSVTGSPLQAGSITGDSPFYAYDSGEAGVTGSISVATSSGGGGITVPSTGQIYPLGYQ